MSVGSLTTTKGLPLPGLERVVHVLPTEPAVSVFPESIAEITDLTGRPVRTDFHTTRPGRFEQGVSALCRSA